MRKLIVIGLFIALCNAGNSQNLQVVLEKNSRAMNMPARESIYNLRTNGYFVMKDTEAKIPFKIFQKKPDLLRIETTIFGFKTIQTYNGHTAWLLSPTQGMEAKQSDSREMEFITAATAINGPFSINKDDKYVLKYVGADIYQGKPVEVVMWSSEKERLKYYIDSGDYYISGIRYEYQKNGGWYSMEYRIKSYLDFQGSKFPGEISAIVNGVEMVSLFVTKIKALESLDLKLFEKPFYDM